MDVLSLLVPPLCVACRRGSARGAALCGDCALSLRRGGPLRGSPPPGVGEVWSAARNDGVARDLVLAVKYRRLVRAVETMAERIAACVPDRLFGGALVPVPASPLRLRKRGFDAAAELAAALARRTEGELRPCLVRRGAGRQVGRGRRARLASPPAVAVRGAAPSRALLVDDVMTTGATLAACARVLRRKGCEDVRAVTFAREL